MIDRIVHHAKVLNLTGSSYRLREQDRTPASGTIGQRLWTLYSTGRTGPILVALDTLGRSQP
ncbi:ATP-binding protein [Arthrobacter sp. NPDC058130]|uniref:ATP-binding protein n=1 Tax=Arthrobacter sp. NPDC058130 TaxID=3346353 RepID=UPI0036E8FE2D